METMSTKTTQGVTFDVRGRAWEPRAFSASRLAGRSTFAALGKATYGNAIVAAGAPADAPLCSASAPELPL
jgi:hypothetical protein